MLLVLEVILYVIVFAVLQVVVSACLVACNVTGAPLLVVATAVSSVLTMVLFVALRWTMTGLSYVHQRHMLVLLYTCVLAIALVLPLQYIEDLFAMTLPEKFTEMYLQIINHPWGYVVIGILAPIAEEMVFRGAVLRQLLRLSWSPWWAIIVSAILFGVIHGNIAQFTHAVVIGVLLGWLYTVTHSIVPGVIIHWVNNTVAFVSVRLFPETVDLRLDDLFQGNTMALYVSVLASTIVAGVALWGIARRVQEE